MGWETESEAPTFLGTLADLLRSKLTEGPKPFTVPTPEQLEKELGDASNFVTPMAGPAALGIIAGKGARTAIPELVDLVATMLRNKRLPDDAFAASQARGQGWYNGPEGKMKFEIPDSQVRMHPYVERDLRRSISPVEGDVSAFIDHPELFKAYPDLADLKVVGQIDPTMNKTHGSYTDSIKTIEAHARTQEDWMKILLHELQHGVQKIEGFDPGANSEKIYDSLIDTYNVLPSSKLKKEAFDLYRRNMGEAEARAVENRWARRIPSHISPEHPAGGYDELWANLIRYGDLP